MERVDRIKLAIERGYTYEPKTGIIYNTRGNEVKRLSLGYIEFIIYFNKKQYKIKGHHFGWYWVNKSFSNNVVIDHINQIRNDNTISNLREITKQENHFNTKAKGYTYVESKNRYLSQIVLNQKRIYLGLFKTEEEARNAYLTAKEKYHIIEKEELI